MVISIFNSNIKLFSYKNVCESINNLKLHEMVTELKSLGITALDNHGYFPISKQINIQICQVIELTMEVNIPEKKSRRSTFLSLTQNEMDVSINSSGVKHDL